MNMLIMGAPGSGKGTHSEIISEKLNIPTISTGAMLRSAIADNTEIGQKAAAYINEGKLVPDEVMIDLVLARVSQDDCENGYILDGFPRTLAQAEAMANANINVDVVLKIDVDDEVIMQRLGGRRVCGKCGATYNVKFKPSAKGDNCEVCDAPLTIRDDDKPETIADRLKVYHEVTAPVIDYYKKLGKLTVVQNKSSIEETNTAIMKALCIKL